MEVSGLIFPFTQIRGLQVQGRAEDLLLLLQLLLLQRGARTAWLNLYASAAITLLSLLFLVPMSSWLLFFLLLRCLDDQYEAFAGRLA